MIKFYNKDLFQVGTDSRLDIKGQLVKFRSIPIGIEKKEFLIGACLADNDYQKENIRVSTTLINRKPNIKIRASNNNRFDMDIYMMAIPFNGIIQPIPGSFDYRIYRAFIAQSDRRDIEFEGKLYKKIAYLIMAPNTQLLQEYHTHHKDTLEFDFSFVNREGNDSKTICKKTTISIRFTKEGLISTMSEKDVSDEYVDGFTKGKTFPIYTPHPKKTSDDKNNSEKPSKFPVKKNSYDKFKNAGTYTKKEKEKPIRKKKPQTTSGDDNLDAMIEEMNRKWSCEPARKEKRSKKQRK